MKKIKRLSKDTFLGLGCVLFLFVGSLNAQNIEGSWEGKLKVQGIELRIVFNLNEADGVFEGTMDSPDQNAFGIPLSEVLVKGDSVTIKVNQAGISFLGKVEGPNCIGTFKQGAFEVEMPLTKSTSEVKKLNRPQEPQPPFDYPIEEVQFYNKSADITLAGTLTLPNGDGPFPVVVLISGSGAQDRNEEIFGHKPFMVIADDFAKKGIAVLRFDDRGTAESEGNHAIATSADFATDVSAAVDYLKGRKEIDMDKIGLVGHSEGGVIAPMVQNMRDDIAFMILMAGSGVPGHELLLEQQRLIGLANGMIESQLEESAKVNSGLFQIIVNSTGSLEETSEELRKYLEESLKDNPSLSSAAPEEQKSYISGVIRGLNSPWMQYFLKYDPSKALEKTTCPVLAINGDLDLQVPAKMNLEAISQALDIAGNKQYETVEFPKLNHLFQECETGALSEYGKIEQTIAPIVLDTMSAWILKL